MRVALLLAPLSCVMFGCGTAPSVAPEAEIVQATVEGPGTALAGRPIRFTLHIVNTGNKDVSLRTVIPGCGCTALECEAQSILPGESVRIAGEMSARKRCGIHNIGLTCEFGDGSTLRVGRSVSVVSGIEATPRTVSLRPNGEDSALCHVDVTVTNRLTSPVHLRVVNSAADHVDSLSVFPMELTLTPGARQTLRVACANDELLRREGVVRLMSSGAVNTMVTIPLVVAPTDGITLSRSIIHLGYVTREDAKLRALASIDVDSAAGAKWELQGG